MENLNLAKGNKLEKAVEIIEKTILEINPALRGGKFEIEAKKRIANDGAGYEIDLYVEIDQGFGYKSIFIFECKNWESKVSRNEITEFSEKIKIANAQKGFFIAKEYTSDAEARAKQDEKIELLYFDDNPLDLTQFVQFEFVKKINKIRAIEIFEYGVANLDKTKSQVLDFENSNVSYKNQEGKLKDFAILLIEEMASEKMRDEKLKMIPNLKSDYLAEKEFLFQKGELYLKDVSFDREVEKIKIAMTFEMELIRPNVISQIDVRTRGRVIEYEAVKNSTGGEIKFTMVAIKP